MFDSNRYRIKTYNDVAQSYWTRSLSGYGNVGAYWDWWYITETGVISRYNGGTKRFIVGFAMGTYEQAHLKNVTWEQVLASIDAGTYATDYAIGDIIPLTVNEQTLNAEIVAINPNDEQHIEF